MKTVSLPCSPLDLAEDTDSVERFYEVCRFSEEANSLVGKNRDIVGMKAARRGDSMFVCVLIPERFTEDQLEGIFDDFHGGFSGYDRILTGPPIQFFEDEGFGDDDIEDAVKSSSYSLTVFKKFGVIR